MHVCDEGDNLQLKFPRLRTYTVETIVILSPSHYVGDFRKGSDKKNKVAKIESFARLPGCRAENGKFQLKISPEISVTKKISPKLRFLHELMLRNSNIYCSSVELKKTKECFSEI